MIFLSATGCGPAQLEAPPPLEVEFHGCRHLLASSQPPICITATDHPLQLWLPATLVASAPGAAVALEIDGQTSSPNPGQKQAGGVLFQIDIPTDASELRVILPGSRKEQDWRLSLRADSLQQSKNELRQSVQEQPGLATAKQYLQQRLTAMQLPGLRAFTLSTMARIESRLGNSEAAIDLFRRAMVEHREWHDVRGELDDGTLMFRELFYQLEDIPRAIELLQQLPEAIRGDARSQYLMAFYRGSMARRIGDTRAAIHWLTEAATSAHRFRLGRLRQQAEQLLALQLSSLGQHQRAASLLKRSTEELAELPPCEAGQLFNNIGWHRLLAVESGQPFGDPLPALQQAEKLLAECDAQQQVNLQLNLALAHLQRGNAEPASRHLGTATELTKEPRLRWLLWWREIEARIALSGDQPALALELYSDLAQLARDVSSPEARWRATLGQARSLRATGRTAQSLKAFADAEALLDTASLRVPIDADREGSISVYGVGTREYLELLLREERHEEAFRVAREARSRATRTLQTQARLSALNASQQSQWASMVKRYQAGQRALDEELDDAWQIPVAQLDNLRQWQATQGDKQRRLLDEAIAILDSGRPISDQLGLRAPGELLLLFHPLSQSWVGFAAGDHGLTVRRLDFTAPASLQAAFLQAPESQDSANLAEQLLQPFETAIGRHSRLRILPLDSLFEIDFHALPWRGEPLLASHAVVYGLDLPRSTEAVARPLVALLVADPSGTLPAATALEVPQIQRLLSTSASPWEIQALSGQQATAMALRRGLETATLLHFAGHADVLGRTDSHLRLAAESRLALGEILTLQVVPQMVILSACEGARPEAATSFAAGTRLGLAQAFLLAGSHQVIATTRPVSDRLTTDLMSEFYRLWLAGQPPDQALRLAQSELRDRQPVSDWAAFRLLER